MRLFNRLKGTENLEELFTTLCNCPEFQEFNLRVSHKKTLNELNSALLPNNTRNTSPLRFPLPSEISTVSQKVSCLLQAQLGNVTIKDNGLVQEALKINQVAAKLAKCMFEYFKIQMKDEEKPTFNALVNSLLIVKCLETNLWENSPYLMKQIPKIGAISANSLAKAGIDSFTKLTQSNPRDIEQILRRAPPFGTEITEMVLRLPTYSLSMQLLLTAANDRSSIGDLKVNVKQLNGDYEHNLNDDEISLIVGLVPAGKVLFYKDKLQIALKSSNAVEFKIRLTSEASSNQTLLVAHLIHHSIVGLDQQKSLTIGTNSTSTTTEKWLLKRGDGESRLKEFEYVPPKKIVKLENEDEFTLDDVFERLDTSCHQSENTMVTNEVLLSLTEAQEKFPANVAPKNIEEVLYLITGKNPGLRPCRTFEDILKDEEDDAPVNFKQQPPSNLLRQFFA